MPDVIYLHIGENDLGHMCDGQIFRELLHLIHELSRLSRSRIVIVGQLLSFLQMHRQHCASVLHNNDALRHHIQPFGAMNLDSFVLSLTFLA